MCVQEQEGNIQADLLTGNYATTVLIIILLLLRSVTILACMGTYPGYKLHTFVWKQLHSPLEIWYMGAYPGVGSCPGHYSTTMSLSRYEEGKKTILVIKESKLIASCELHSQEYFAELTHTHMLHT